MSRSKQVIINTLGTYGNIGFSFLQTLIQFNTLSRAEFGILSVLLGLSYLLTNIFDFGTVATTYAKVPHIKATSPHKLFSFGKTIWSFQTTLCFLALTVLFIIFPFLDKYVLKINVGIAEYAVTAISVLFFVWQNLISNMFFAAKNFLAPNVAANVAHIAKLLLIYLSYLQGTISALQVLIILGVIGPLVFFVIMAAWYPQVFIRAFKSRASKAFLELKFTLTYFVSTQIYTLGTRIDLFIVSYFFPKDVLGNYALAQRMMIAASSTVISVTQVLSPHYSVLKTKAQILKEFGHSLKFLFIPAALFVALIATPPFVFALFFKNISPDTILILKLLCIPYIVFTFGNIPYLYTLYTVKRSDIILNANLLFLTTVVVSALIFIPYWGLAGAAMGLIAGYVANVTYLYLWTHAQLKNLKA